jgi:protein SCO1/2
MTGPTPVGLRAAVLAVLWVMAAAGGGHAETASPFSLTNWDGRPVTLDALKGRTTIVTFTFAKCVFACPMVTFQLKALDEALGSPSGLTYLHVSVNPAADTPEEILSHFRKHDIDPRRDPRWLFATGSETQTAAVLAAYGIEVKRSATPHGEMIEPTVKVVVIDPDGQIVATFDSYQWDDKEMRHALAPLPDLQ